MSHTYPVKTSAVKSGSFKENLSQHIILKSHFENLGQISSNFFVNLAAQVHFERKEVQIVDSSRKKLSLRLSRQLRWVAESWARVCVLVEMVGRNMLRLAHRPIA